MNYLVFLNPHAGELEKILSGVKCILLKEINPGNPGPFPVEPGDTLYFLRDNPETSIQVKAAVCRVFVVPNDPDEDLSHTLKALQPRLQLTENQYNDWSAKTQVLLIEFDHAQKVNALPLASDKIADRRDWIAFEEFSMLM